MTDAKKESISAAKQVVIDAAQGVLRPAGPVIGGLPPGIRVEVNTQAVARFPLKLALPSLLVLGVGIVAAMRGYRVVGYGLAGLGAVGIGASAAAPELNAALNRMRVP